MAERTEPLPVVVQAEPVRRRRFGWIIAIVVVLALLVAAFFGADALARQYASDYVRDRVIQVLALDPATPVEVDLGPGSILLQAARGSVDELTVHAGEVTFGEITGSAELTATGVPLSGTEPVDTIDIRVTIDEANVRKLAALLSGYDLGAIDLIDGVIRITAQFEALFLKIPVSVDLVPAATPGGVRFEPVEITLNDQVISVQGLREHAVFGALASQLLASQEFCVADHLPTALTVTSVEVVGTELVIAIDGDGASLAGPELSTLGSCQ